MKHISILVPVGHSSVTNIEGTQQILEATNDILRAKGEEPVFHVQLVGIEHQSSQRGGRYTIQPDVLIQDVPRTDLIIIPAMHDLPGALQANAAFKPWILQQYAQGAEVASFCIGAFFLADTGLLNGKQAATHWQEAHHFRTMFPQVKLVDDKIMTAQDRLYTSGGAYSSLNLLAYLIEQYAGRDVAVHVAKIFMIDIDRVSQSPFIMFNGQKNHADENILRAQNYIEENYEERITVEQLASVCTLGRRSLERRFKKATSNTVTEYIQRVKIEAAKRAFETSTYNINEIMDKVGYTDVKSFRSVFKKLTGLSPLSYRNKYNREVMMN
ncbi:transcriptional regulator GlxA family with amidase domain [Chitinophaga skermanii]|uniref:Transcriptional regulator GlxA family with amidase domain n=1 Tax=Chitinophaga skermanii TaxID=331697 RepID=A0A327QXX6_9BACT|nr:helix-turn-helix domain-containing protein [Chitinophaga skermanii]RAJ08618.1 transcriptional regulator GlxA family with amidase domain [Chitinophaga skermanii]